MQLANRVLTSSVLRRIHREGGGAEPRVVPPPPTTAAAAAPPLPNEARRGWREGGHPAAVSGQGWEAASECGYLREGGGGVRGGVREERGEGVREGNDE